MSRQSKQFSFSESLPFLNRPENIARYEDGVVYILDRRVYPHTVRFVRCGSYEEVAGAIRDMVTQSYGPKFAALYGMVQAAKRFKTEPASVLPEKMREAADVIIQSRPMNGSVRRASEAMLRAAEKAAEAGEDIEDAVLRAADAYVEEDSRQMDRLGKNGAELIRDGDTVLTHCWADTTLVYTLVNVLKQGKKIEVICTETRPYLQGARLTAAAVTDMGIPATVITDNMPAHIMSLGMVNSFFCGCDRLTLSGHVFNKVGTLQIALCARHFGIPVYVFSFGPDPSAAGPEDVKNEIREGNETLYCLGQRTAAPGVKGFYPAFDATPPEYVTRIVTDTGLYSPFEMRRYWEPEQNRK